MFPFAGCPFGCRRWGRAMSDERCFICKGPADEKSPTGHWFCQECREKNANREPGARLAEFLDQVRLWLERYVVFPNDAGAVAVSLWVAFSHVTDIFDVAPYLLVTAPEIESGKTRVWEVAEPLIHKPLSSASMTPAVLFRTIEANHPTLFLDEADNFWTGSSRDDNAELVALLNAGHRRGVKAYRMGGNAKTTLEEFDVFGPKMVAGKFPDIGKIPEGLRSRSIHIRMKRKLPGEKVERWTRQARAATNGEVEALQSELSATLDNADLAGIHITPLSTLSDREFDIWEPLLVIAEAAGAHWPADAHEAAIILCSPDPSESEPHQLTALRDVRDVWTEDEPFMYTASILERLHELEDRPWSDYYGTKLTGHRLAKFLGAYGVEPRPEPGPDRRNGYYHQDLQEPWERYATPPDAPPDPGGLFGPTENPY